MEIQKIGWITALLDDGDQESDSPGMMADRIIELFSGAEKALSPIIGLRGLAILQYSNIKKISIYHPWFLAVSVDANAPLNLQLLRPVFIEQSVTTVKMAGLDLLQNFYAVLSGLIGLSLAEMLLRSVWELSSSKYARGI